MPLTYDFPLLPTDMDMTAAAAKELAGREGGTEGGREDKGEGAAVVLKSGPKPTSVTPTR